MSAVPSNYARDDAIILQQCLARTRHQIRLASLRQLFWQTLLLTLATLNFAALLVITFGIALPTWRVMGLMLLSMIFAVWCWRRPISLLQAALLLDEQYRLAERVTACYCLLYQDGQTRFRDRLLHDTVTRLAQINRDFQLPIVVSPLNPTIPTLSGLLLLVLLTLLVWPWWIDSATTHGTTVMTTNDAHLAGTLAQTVAALDRAGEPTLAQQLREKARRSSPNDRLQVQLRSMLAAIRQQLEQPLDDVSGILRRRLAHSDSTTGDPFAESDAATLARRLADLPDAERAILQAELATLAQRLSDKALQELIQAMATRIANDIKRSLVQAQENSRLRQAARQHSQSLLAQALEQLGGDVGLLSELPPVTPDRLPPTATDPQSKVAEGLLNHALPQTDVATAPTMTQRSADFKNADEMSERKRSYLKKAWWPAQYQPTISRYFGSNKQD